MVEWKTEKPFLRRYGNLEVGLLGTVVVGTAGLSENKKKIWKWSLGSDVRRDKFPIIGSGIESFVGWGAILKS